MKITYFDPEKSVPKESVAFITDPPLSEEVYNAFGDVGDAGSFTFENGCLVLHDLSRLNNQFKSLIEQHLTEAERFVESKKQATTSFHQQFVKAITEKTGISARSGTA